MHFSLFATLALAASTSAFRVRYANSENCGNIGITVLANVSSGCIVPDSQFTGLNVKWVDEHDNPLILAAYTDDKCCHSATAVMYDWRESCQALQSLRSFRALDPNKPNVGAKDADYQC